MTIEEKSGLRSSLCIVILIGTLLRFLLGLFDNPLDHLFSDPARHWDNAARFLKPQLMGGCDPIIYQVYLFVVRVATNGNYVAVGIMTGALSAVMPWLFYRAARSFGLPKLWSICFWCIVLWLPSFLAIYRYFMMETLLLPLIGLGLWMTGRSMRKKDLPSFLLTTAIWTLAIFTKSQAIPIAMLCWFYAFWPLSRKFAAVGCSLGIAGLILVPNAIRTKAILGFYAPFGCGYIAQIMHASQTTHTGFKFNSGTWTYSSPSCYIAPLDPINQWRIERGVVETKREVAINSAHGRQDWEDALAQSPRTWNQWCANEGENLVLFFFAPSWPDSGKDYAVGWLNHQLRWLWGPIIFQVLVGNAFLFWKKQFQLIPVVTSLMLLLLMFQNSVTMEGRYRKPLEPLLILNIFWLWAPLSGVNRRTALVDGKLGAN